MISIAASCEEERLDVEVGGAEADADDPGSGGHHRARQRLLGQHPAITEGKADDEPGRPAVELEDGVVAEGRRHHDPGGEEGCRGQQAQPPGVPEPCHPDHDRQQRGGEHGPGDVADIEGDRFDEVGGAAVELRPLRDRFREHPRAAGPPVGGHRATRRQVHDGVGDDAGVDPGPWPVAAPSHFEDSRRERDQRGPHGRAQRAAERHPDQRDEHRARLQLDPEEASTEVDRATDAGGHPEELEGGLAEEDQAGDDRCCEGQDGDQVGVQRIRSEERPVEDPRELPEHQGSLATGHLRG